MTTMQLEKFEAFRSIGAPEDKALKAAEALGKRDSETELSFKKHDVEISGIKTDLPVIKWMMGFVLVFQVAIFAKLFLH